MGLRCTLKEQSGTSSILVTEPAWLSQPRAIESLLGSSEHSKGYPSLHSPKPESVFFFFQLLSQLDYVERSIFCSLVKALLLLLVSLILSFLLFILLFYFSLPSLIFLHHKGVGILEQWEILCSPYFFLSLKTLSPDNLVDCHIFNCYHQGDD